MTPALPFDLLLPDAVAERVLVLGSRRLPLAAPATPSPGGVDLVLLVPTADEARREGWLDEAVGRARLALAPDGLVLAVTPRRLRRRLRRLLLGAGLPVGDRFALIPRLEAVRFVAPLLPTALRYLAGRWASTRPGVLRPAEVLSRAPFAARALAAVLPDVAYAAGRPGGRPPLEWLSRLVGEKPAAVVLQTSWRGTGGPAVLHCFRKRARAPWAVVKVTEAGSGAGERPVAIAAGAEAAGARVPRPLASTRLPADRRASVLTALPGTAAADVLARTPARLDVVLESVASWLARWNERTAEQVEVSAAALEERVLGRAGDLLMRLEDGDSYRRRVAESCAAAARGDLPLVAAHNDLTMWNVVLATDAPLGVLDWDEAGERQLPLLDFYYAVADAAAACRGYDSRTQAVAECFGPGGTHVALVASLQRRVAAACGVSPAAAELAFHACWLWHAANELRAGEGRQFLDVVRWSARQLPAGPP